MVLDSVDFAVLFNKNIISFPAFGFFTVGGLKSGVGDHDYIKTSKIFHGESFHLRIGIVVDQHFEFAICVLLDLILPLH